MLQSDVNHYGQWDMPQQAPAWAKAPAPTTPAGPMEREQQVRTASAAGGGGNSGGYYNNLFFPTFSQSDFRSQNPFDVDAYLYANSRGDSAQFQRDEAARVWGLTPEAAQRYFNAGNRDIRQGTEAFVADGSGVSSARGTNANWSDTNYWPEFDAQGNMTGFTIKSGDKEGTYVPYKLENGQYVPDFAGARGKEYYTNSGDVNKGIATVLGAAALGGAASQGMLGQGAQNLMTGGAPGAATAPGVTAGTATATANPFGAPLMSSLPGAGAFGAPATGAGAAMSGAGGLGGGALASGAAGAVASGLPGWLSNVGNVAGRVGDFLSGPAGRLITSIGGARDESRARREVGRGLQDMYNRERELADPYLQRLRESYEDPSKFLSSAEFTAGRDIYQNAIDRQAAASGRLANPTDREVLLDKYAMAAMNDYRQGLANNVNNLLGNARGYAGFGADGLGWSASRNAPWWQAAGHAQTRGGGAGDVIKAIRGAGSTISDIWNMMRRWF